MQPHNQNGHHAQQCDACGKPLARNLKGRRKRFCSDACRDSARRANNFAVLGCRREPRNDSKTPCGTAASFVEKRGRASGITGPKHVIDIELGGLVWIEDGVALVAHIKPPALIRTSGGAA
jgi:hypothetical protein